jgi:hypothetical protein
MSPTGGMDRRLPIRKDAMFAQSYSLRCPGWLDGVPGCFCADKAAYGPAHLLPVRRDKGRRAPDHPGLPASAVRRCKG